MDAGATSGFLHFAARDLSAESCFRVFSAPRAKSPPPQAVAAARGRLRGHAARLSTNAPCRRGMRYGIAVVAPPCIRPRGTRDGTSHPFQQPAEGFARALPETSVI